MIWHLLIELDYLLSLIILIIYGLLTLKKKIINLQAVFTISKLKPLIYLVGAFIENCNISFTPTMDFFIAILTIIVMDSLKNFEAILLILIAFIGNILMLHSIDIITFYITLEMQNFCYFVLAALIASKISSSFNIEMAIKFFLLSSFASGALLYWFSNIYLLTGCTTLNIIHLNIFGLNATNETSYLILCCLLFKLGAAPMHNWVTSIYSGVKRALILYVNTIPKLCLIDLWQNILNLTLTYHSIIGFSIISLILGAFNAYNQPALRTLLAYSTINEMGLILLAIESNGFSSLYGHLFLYIINQIVLWHINDKTLLNIIAITLASLPPFANFLGKAYIFWNAISSHLLISLIISLITVALSLVYYIRLIRLFYNTSGTINTRFINSSNNAILNTNRLLLLLPNSIVYNKNTIDYNYTANVGLIALSLITLIVIPVIIVKPFVSLI